MRPAPIVPFWVGSLSLLLGFRIFRRHGFRLRADELSAPSESFIARVSASITTADCRPDRETIFPAVDTAFASAFAASSVGRTGSAEAPAADINIALHAPSLTSILKGAGSDEIVDLTGSSPSPPGTPAPRTTGTLQSFDRISI